MQYYWTKEQTQTQLYGDVDETNYQSLGGRQWTSLYLWCEAVSDHTQCDARGSFQSNSKMDHFANPQRRVAKAYPT